LSFRFFRFLTFSLTLALFPAYSQTQNTPAPAPQTQPPAAVPAAQTTPAPQTQPPAAAPAAQTTPDYPDPRTFTIGLFYWATNNTLGTQPSLFTGKQALDYENLPNLGKPHQTPALQVSFPITRTGEIKVDAFLLKGTGNSVATVKTDPFYLQTPFNPGDYIASQYQIKNVHIYLDDLLWPHKFPVSKFRLKSLWGLEWNAVHVNATSPLNQSPVIADNTMNIVQPTFGIAAEYAPAPHLLFRVSTDGFAIPHKSLLGEAQGEISYRKGSLEIVGGGRFLHVKSSPNSTTYVSATFIGAFAGVRWHFSNLF
jgi:hypothetical protein